MNALRPTSERQLTAVVMGHTPPAERFDEGLWSFPTSTNEAHPSYTLTVIAVSEVHGVTVVDPGADDPRGVDRLDAFLRTIGFRIHDVRQILLTHSHHDHIGLAAAVQRVSQAEVFLHPADQAALNELTAGDRENPLEESFLEWGLPRSRWDEIRNQEYEPHGPAHRLGSISPLADGAHIRAGDFYWTVRATPGHTPGSVCFVDHEKGRIITGDHILPIIAPGIGLSIATLTNPVEDYLTSLDKLADADSYEVLPGHGYHFHGLRIRRNALAQRVLTRATEVATALRNDPHLPAYEIAARLTWTFGWEALQRSPSLPSALWQVDLYREFIYQGGLRRIPEHSIRRAETIPSRH